MWYWLPSSLPQMQQVVNVYPALLDHTMTGRLHLTVTGCPAGTTTVRGGATDQSQCQDSKKLK